MLLLGPRQASCSSNFVGLELIRWCRIHAPRARVRFRRDPEGPEVDWVVEHEGRHLPIEVKLGDRPSDREARHVRTF